MANKKTATDKEKNAAKRKASLAVLNKHVSKKKVVEATVTKAAKDPRMQKSGFGKGGGNKGGVAGYEAKKAANKASAYKPKNSTKGR